MTREMNSSDMRPSFGGGVVGGVSVAVGIGAGVGVVVEVDEVEACASIFGARTVMVDARVTVPSVDSCRWPALTVMIDARPMVDRPLIVSSFLCGMDGMKSSTSFSSPGSDNFHRPY